MQNQAARVRETIEDPSATASPRVADAIESARRNLESQIHWLDQLPASIKTILDIGCGPGLHSKYFKDRGMAPTAIDRWSDGFQYRNEIEFYEDISELPSGMQFDAVFCSHILEHCPDPSAAIRGWRNYVKDDGHLIVIVPKYDPRPCNDHWITGWNVSQLAMFMAANGFDCSQSIFSQFGINVCGFGKKQSFEPTVFNITKSLPYLPKGLTDLAFKIDHDDFLPGDLALATPGEARRLAEIKVDQLPLDSSAKIVLKMTGEWKDAVFSYPPGKALDLSDQTVFLFATMEGPPSGFRVAAGSDKKSGDWTNSADIWLSFKAGMNLFRFRKEHFKILRGQVNWRAIDQIAFGGQASGCVLTAWLVYGNGDVFIPIK